VRAYFANGDVAHIRPSGNAPQLRIYANSDSQARADRIVSLAVRDSTGILRMMEQAFS
jgi:phosphomannomutase